MLSVFKEVGGYFYEYKGDFPHVDFGKVNYETSLIFFNHKRPSSIEMTCLKMAHFKKIAYLKIVH